MRGSANEAMTVGMRLDAFLDNMGSLANKHVYLITIVVMIVASFLIMSTGQSDQPEPKKFVVAQSEKVSTPTTASYKPSWYVYVRFLNFTFLVCFLASIVEFFWHASIYSSETTVMYKFLIEWSIYLSYYFSFSGVSLLYDSLEKVDQQTRYVSV
jgi:quinol-cytochrome oxidoreductase complex cytochrome b subunit